MENLKKYLFEYLQVNYSDEQVVWSGTIMGESHKNIYLIYLF